jgi:hypothetical protein
MPFIRAGTLPFFIVIASLSDVLPAVLLKDFFNVISSFDVKIIAGTKERDGRLQTAASGKSGFSVKSCSITYSKRCPDVLMTVRRFGTAR